MVANSCENDWSFFETERDFIRPEVNVLASMADWAWPKAIEDIFRPRDVTLLVAQSAGEFMDVLKMRRIHTAIVDMDGESGGLATIRIIRMSYPRVPCIALSSGVCQRVLSKALELDVFSVIDKPVDMKILREQLHRLFLRKYNSSIFE
jgi:DNA-binding NarL/FixJ family response regulator